MATRPWPTRWIVASALVLGAMPLLAAEASAQPATTPPVTPPPATPAPDEPEPGPPFLPGVWKGTAVGLGTISGGGATAFVSVPFIMKFEFEVAPDGTVVSGVWSWSGEVSVAADNVEGTFAMTGSGPVGGTGARVEYTGTIHQSGSVTAQGNVVPVEGDVAALGHFSPLSVSCAVASGDIAVEGRQAQADAGISTTITGPFTAQRVAPPDLGLDFQEQFVQLVLQAEALVAAGLPDPQSVVDLVQQAQDFYQNVFLTGECAGGAPTLLPGQQPYTTFVKVISDLLLTALANADAYSVDDINVLAAAALQMGVIGGAAPDPALDAEVTQAFHDVLEDKLAAAEAEQNKTDCIIISLTATALAMNDIAGQAAACAGG
jgi:hypothetical protein